MNIKITPGLLTGSVNSITSKSHAHRLMIASALCETPCHVNISSMNEDLEATQNCLSTLGDIAADTGFDCGESGSTLRFLLPIAMVLKDRATFFGRGRLPERPLSPLKEEMEAHGCSFFTDAFDSPHSSSKPSSFSRHIFTICGRLQGGTFNLAGNVSSQYITGLLFALPLLEEDSLINITTKLESTGYVRLTLDVLELFGIDIEVHGDYSSFSIRGSQRYVSPGDVVAEGDWSNGAFWITADGLTRKVSGSSVPAVFCENLNLESSQGDKEIVDFAERVATAADSDILRFDVADVPDLVPVLAVLAASRHGITEIVNAGRLRIKESDRLATVSEMINSLGGDATQLPDSLIINGTGLLQGGSVDGCNDHRIVMAAAIASILCKDPVTIIGAEAVNKSYPRFFNDFNALGGEYVVL